mmetsp:Transcript_20122/g.46898  ORF Transcript_20122/g.46898 Transcript_20122/m.46898 type:complete len:387 (-) Transcript_20122:8-1168(-)
MAAGCEAEEDRVTSTTGDGSKPSWGSLSDGARMEDSEGADDTDATPAAQAAAVMPGGWNAETEEASADAPPVPGGDEGGRRYSQGTAWRSNAGEQRNNVYRGSTARSKRRFCTSFPETATCRRGSTCAFAHSREEIHAPLLSVEEETQDPSAMSDDFFMYKYKTMWCPIGVQHEWHSCVYAHNYQDARRPLSIGYGPRLCPYWNKKDTCTEYSQRCPLGLRCPCAHGAKEQLYHPHYFKTVTCRDLKSKACPRQQLCAFFHQRSEKRLAPADEVDYSVPLREEDMAQEWVQEFLSPPFAGEPIRGDAPNNGDSRFEESQATVIPYAPQASIGEMRQVPGPYQAQPGYCFIVPIGVGMNGMNGMNGMMCAPPAGVQGNWCYMMPVMS